MMLKGNFRRGKRRLLFLQGAPELRMGAEKGKRTFELNDEGKAQVGSALACIADGFFG